MTGLLLVGASVFVLGRILRPRAARRVWLACGFAYLAAAGIGVRSARATAGLEAALGASFIGAGYAVERLEREGGERRS